MLFSFHFISYHHVMLLSSCAGNQKQSCLYIWPVDGTTMSLRPDSEVFYYHYQGDSPNKQIAHPAQRRWGLWPKGHFAVPTCQSWGTPLPFANILC